MQRNDLWILISQNCDTTKNQIARNTPYAKVSPRTVFSMLNSVSGRQKTIATKLLDVLATRPWYIFCAPHEGGTSPNAPWHLTLRVIDHGVHLNCKQNDNDTLYIYEITWDRKLDQYLGAPNYKQ
jgi:hypothetical protein